jgi:hypothetical protein
MSDPAKPDFGPLAGLIGIWTGDKGTDIAPEPDGSENNPYFETITFSAVGGVTNAEAQDLMAVHYHQIVQRKSNEEVFHNETGYWMWDKDAGVVMHSLVIPRAVGLLAGGPYSGETDDAGRTVFEVAAAVDDPDWGIVQSPFMRDNARTLSFSHRLAVGNGELVYSETTIIDIYGKRFEHTDENQLTKAP